MPLKPEEQLIGKTFEKCRILAKLGTGGMGSVYLAEHFGLGRKVAVKILPSDMSRDPEYVARFMREATTAGRMEHPNIVQIHDVGYAEGRHFIVMQYVDGESLSTVVDELGAMEPHDAARTAVGILRGLQHAHEQGIVHRDIKPDNVLITKGNEPKVLDFGLAIETEASLHITRDGMVVGTPYYLSPEQARGQKATPVCDVYATGVTLYYLVTGKRPFVGATALAVLNKHIHDAAVPPVQHNPAIPKTLNDIILKMMAKKPEDRYPSAGAAADALESFLAGRAVDARVPFHFPRTLDEFRQLPKKIQIAAAAGAGAVVLLVLLLVLLPGGKPDVAEHAPAPPPAVDSPDTKLLAEAIENESAKKGDFASWSGILEKYEAVVRAVSSAEVKKKAQAERDRFAEQVQKAGDAEYAKLKNDADPVARAKELARFPKPLIPITSAGSKVQSELTQVPILIERKFDDEDAKLQRLFDAGRFGDARAKLASLKDWAPPTRKDRLAKIEADLPALERSFNDPLVQAYAKVHDAFAKRLAKRATKEAFDLVAAWMREPRDAAETERLRPAAISYDRIFAIRPEPNFPVELLNDARLTLAETLQRGDDRVGFQALSDLLDACDVAWLIGRGVAGVRQLDQSKKEVALAAFGGPGRVTYGPPHILNFVPRAGPEKAIVLTEVPVRDLLLLAAAAEGDSPEAVGRVNGPFARAAGASWVYSDDPAHLAEAGRWLSRSAEQRTPGPAARMEKLRELGRRQARDRLAKAQLDGRSGKFDQAHRDLKEVQTLWSFDPDIKSEAARAIAALLAAELPRAADSRTYERAKSLARELRASYAGFYDEAAALKTYSHVLQQSGYWEFVSTDLVRGDAWTWEAKGTGAPAPVKDEGAVAGLHFPQGVAVLGLSPSRTRGKSGLSAEFRVNDPKRPFAAGIRFDASETDGKYKLLALEFPSRVALYQVDGAKRTEIKSAAPDLNLSSKPWIDVTFISEAGDLLCTVNHQPVILVTEAVNTNRGILLASDADVNVKNINLRR